MTEKIEAPGSCQGGNTVPKDDDGHVYHVGCKHGEIADRVLVVSDYVIAEEIAKLFEGTPFKRPSSRGYTTYTGQYKGQRVSLIAIGIGFEIGRAHV